MIGDATTTWSHGGAQSEKINAQRDNESDDDWADDHIAAILNGGPTTQPASGPFDFESTIHWTAGGIEYHTKVRTSGTSTKHDQRVDKMKTKIEANGGTVTSVT